MRRSPLPRGFGTIWTTVALDLVGFGIVLPILPLYARRYHASPGVAGALVAAFSLAQFLGAPVWGRISDRVGRKPVLIVSLVGTAVGSLLTGLAAGLPLLFIARLLDGASGASVSVAQASVADIAEPSQRARLFGLLGAAFGLGLVLGPAIGGALSPISPRLPFFAAAAVAAVNAAVATRRLPETHRPAAGSTRRAEGAWRRPGVVPLIAVAFLALIAFSGFEGTFALFGAARLGWHQTSTYVVFTLIGLVIVVDQFALVHPVVARWGERTALQAGLVLNGIGLASVAVVHSDWALIVPLLLLTAGQGLITPTLSSAVAGMVGPSERGQVLGVQQAAGGVARTIGPALAGLAFGHIGVWSPYLGGAAVVAVAAALLAGAPASPALDHARSGVYVTDE